MKWNYELKITNYELGERGSPQSRPPDCVGGVDFVDFVDRVEDEEEDEEKGEDEDEDEEEDEEKGMAVSASRMKA